MPPIINAILAIIYWCCKNYIHVWGWWAWVILSHQNPSCNIFLLTSFFKDWVRIGVFRKGICYHIFLNCCQNRQYFPICCQVPQAICCMLPNDSFPTHQAYVSKQKANWESKIHHQRTLRPKQAIYLKGALLDDCIEGLLGTLWWGRNDSGFGMKNGHLKKDMFNAFDTHIISLWLTFQIDWRNKLCVLIKESKVNKSKAYPLHYNHVKSTFRTVPCFNHFSLQRSLWFWALHFNTGSEWELLRLCGTVSF